MILYTPMSNSDVFPEEKEDSSTRQFVSYQGRLLYVEQTDEGSYELLQLLSTDPQDFLDVTYSPGSKFS